MTISGIKTVSDLNRLATQKGQSGFISDLNTQLSRLSQGVLTRPMRYYPRNVEIADFSTTRGNLNADGIRREIDLSQIITNINPILVKIRAEVQHTAYGGLGIQLWPKRFPTDPNRAYVYSQEANIPIMAQMELPINEEKTILCTVSSASFAVCQFMILGWWGV